MSTDALGVRLLAEAKHESLSSLLADIRLILQQRLQTRFGLGQVDDIVDHLEQAHSTFIQRQNESAAPTEPLVDIEDEDDVIDLFSTDNVARHEIPPRPKPAILNLQSQTSSSGIATQSLIYELVARAILPKGSESKQAAVVWLDTRNSFSPSWLINTIVSNIQRLTDDGTAPEQYGPDTIAAQARDSLSHVHAISISSPSQLLHSLQTLPRYLSDCNAHRSSSRVLGLIVLDSATQFQWQDRFEAELARLNALPISPQQVHVAPANQRHPQPPPLSAQMTTLLKWLAIRYECAVLYTTNTQDFYPSSDANPGVSDIWSNTALLTLSAKRTEVTQFAPQMSMQECLRDRQKRQEAIAAGRVRFTASSAGKTIGGFDATLHTHGLQF